MRLLYSGYAVIEAALFEGATHICRMANVSSGNAGGYTTATGTYVRDFSGTSTITYSIRIKNTAGGCTAQERNVSAIVFYR